MGRYNTGEYRGWQAHHVVEKQDLGRLGVAHLFPPENDQLCVLLPERTHIGRINSVLRRQNPLGVQASARELLIPHGYTRQLKRRIPSEGMSGIFVGG